MVGGIGYGIPAGGAYETAGVAVVLDDVPHLGSDTVRPSEIRNAAFRVDAGICENFQIAAGTNQGASYSIFF